MLFCGKWFPFIVDPDQMTRIYVSKLSHHSGCSAVEEKSVKSRTRERHKISMLGLGKMKFEEIQERSGNEVKVNSSLPGQNGCHFPEDILKCIFVNEKFCISLRISLKFLPKGPIDKVSIGSGNSLVPNWQQAITWTIADPVQWQIYAAPGEMS